MMSRRAFLCKLAMTHLLLAVAGPRIAKLIAPRTSSGIVVHNGWFLKASDLL